MRARATPIVIAMQPTRFPNEQTKILYAGFHPEGHRISSGSSLLWSLKPQPSFILTFDTFCMEICKTIGDPDEVASVERHLYLLRQRTSAYLADFTHLSVLLKWDSEAESAQFYPGLKDNIKEILARKPKA